MIISRKYKRSLSWICMIPLKIEFYKKDFVQEIFNAFQKFDIDR